jgi:hypothetical protein
MLRLGLGDARCLGEEGVDWLKEVAVSYSDWLGGSELLHYRGAQEHRSIYTESDVNCSKYLFDSPPYCVPDTTTVSGRHKSSERCKA